MTFHVLNSNKTCQREQMNKLLKHFQIEQDCSYQGEALNVPTAL